MDQHSLENHSLENHSLENHSLESHSLQDPNLENHNGNMRGPGGAAPAVEGYSVCRWLGRGGSAEVWLVSQDATGVKLALKCFGRPSGSVESGAVAAGTLESGAVESAAAGSGAADSRPALTREEDVRRELVVMSVLDHEHLVKAYGVVTVDEPGRTDQPGRTDEPGESGFGLLMDYAAGGSLQQLVTARGTLSVGETVTVLTPIAQVLGYLHGKGFTHSDVAPGNVLFTAHGKPLLADLGVARMVGDSSGVPDRRTDGFADPAPVDAVRAGLQPERDVYAAAALGWYCLTGQPPPPSAARPPLSLLLPDVPAELAAALEAGLSDDRRQRPAAADLATAVYRSAAAAPVDLSRSVHGTVLPELLTRRPVPPSGGRLRKRLLAWRRRLKTAGWGRAMGRLSPRGAPAGTVQALSLPHAAARHAGAGNAVRHAAARHAGAGNAVRHAAARHAGAGNAVRHAPVRHAGVRNGVRRGALRQAAASHAAGRHRTATHGSRRLAVAGSVLAAALLAGAGLLGRPGAAQESGPVAQESVREAGLPASGSGSPQGAGLLGDVLPGDVLPEDGLPDDVRRRLAAKDPAEAVLGLAQLRSLALREGRLHLLDDVNAPNTPAQAADRRIRAGLQENGTVLAGFTTSVSGARRLPESTPARAVVAVTSSTSAYEERSAGGTVVATGARQRDMRLRLVLVPVEGCWRIADILPAD
ncbi:protein kinase [Arthrobacter sp. FW305-BF8]|uniref:serine/threonine protein kinase n=1 Tax=Arthrobacter sp. FW305-BF8 TaxID=2879617 RepID=UPI001EFFF281|nr:protein kinase [Arthrobacter sp. FW305-BF8]UKA56040.1 protein kinase [Arthrobacter sp. FW305-BF8]